MQNWSDYMNRNTSYKGLKNDYVTHPSNLSAFALQQTNLIGSLKKQVQKFISHHWVRLLQPHELGLLI